MRERPPTFVTPAPEKTPGPEQRIMLREYVELRKKLNGAGSEILSSSQLKRLGELRRKLGDDLIKKQVNPYEVNGPVL